MVNYLGCIPKLDHGCDLLPVVTPLYGKIYNSRVEEISNNYPSAMEMITIRCLIFSLGYEVQSVSPWFFHKFHCMFAFSLVFHLATLTVYCMCIQSVVFQRIFLESSFTIVFRDLLPIGTYFKVGLFMTCLVCSMCISVSTVFCLPKIGLLTRAI